jgi:hypothetical protein
LFLFCLLIKFKYDIMIEFSLLGGLWILKLHTYQALRLNAMLHTNSFLPCHDAWQFRTIDLNLLLVSFSGVFFYPDYGECFSKNEIRSGSMLGNISFGFGGIMFLIMGLGRRSLGIIWSRLVLCLMLIFGVHIYTMPLFMKILFYQFLFVLCIYLIINIFYRKKN